jgi:hypothetical protein
MTAHWFGCSLTEEGNSRRCKVRRCGRRGGGANGSRRWEPMYRAKRPSGAGRFRWECRRDENGPSDEMGRKLRRLQHKLFLFLNFKQNFRFKNQRFEILLN